MAPCLKGWEASLVPDPTAWIRKWLKDNGVLQAHTDEQFVYTKSTDFLIDNDFTLTSYLAGRYTHYNST